MITCKLATLGLGLALVLGAAGANAAQPVAGTQTAAPMTQATSTVPAATPMVGKTAKTETGKTETGKIRGVKVGTTKTSTLGNKAGTPKLTSGRSVAVTAPHKVSHRRLHVSMSKPKHLHRTHVAHVARKGSAKHA